MSIRTEYFGTTARGEKVNSYLLSGPGGITAEFINYGCTLRSFTIPDRNGLLTDVVLGYDDIAGYEAGSSSVGAFIGRFANRIKNAEFELDGKLFRLEKNDGENHLHGNFAKEVYEAEISGEELVFRRVSPDGEDGMPGTLEVEVRYFFSGDGGLHMVYEARTDAPTVLNLTNHSYFNLAGSGDILGHELRIDSGLITEIGPGTIPTGRIIPVEDTPFDFRVPKAVGRDIESDDPQLETGFGYDHNYVLGSGGELRPCALLSCLESGISMEVLTTQPGVQLYSGNYIDTDAAPFGKGGVRYPRRAGICLETQDYPCAPNYPQFPSAALRPGEVYRRETVYRLFRS